jgi:hypothetical protein
MRTADLLCGAGKHKSEFRTKVITQIAAQLQILQLFVRSFEVFIE